MAWDAVTHAIARHLAWPRSSRAAAPNVLLAAKIASYVFAPVALLSGIPVFSVIIRYNLVNEGWPKWAANLFAVVFPWVVALVSAPHLLAAAVQHQDVLAPTLVQPSAWCSPHHHCVLPAVLLRG